MPEGIPGFTQDQLPTGTEEEQARKAAEAPPPPPPPPAPEPQAAAPEPPKVTVGTEVILPSRGLPYDGKIPEGKVTVLPLTFSAEKLIATGPNDMSLADVLLPSYVKGIQGLRSHEELTLNDQMYLLWSIRAETRGAGVNLQPRCPVNTCQKRTMQPVLMPDDAYLHMAPDNWKEPFTAHLPYCGGTAELRSLRGSDTAIIARLRERKIREGSDIRQTGDPAYTYQMVQQIVKLTIPPRPRLPEGITIVNDNDQAAERLFGLFDSLHALDVDAIRDALEDNDFGLDARREFTCGNCGRVFEYTVRPEIEFFRSPRKRGGGTSPAPL